MVYGWIEHRPELKDSYLMSRLAWAVHWAEKALELALDGSQDVFYDNAGDPHIDHARVQKTRLQCAPVRANTLDDQQVCAESLRQFASGRGREADEHHH